jgi:hypothetical protein
MTLRSFSANAARNGSAWTLAPIAPPGRSRWLARSPLRRNAEILSGGARVEPHVRLDSGAAIEVE